MQEAQIINIASTLVFFTTVPIKWPGFFMEEKQDMCSRCSILPHSCAQGELSWTCDLTALMGPTLAAADLEVSPSVQRKVQPY